MNNMSKKNFNYRKQEVKCCGTCKHSIHMELDYYHCDVVNDLWGVDEFHICDKFE